MIKLLWGNIITDLAYQTNYWLSFPSSNSDVLSSLTMWQYWWWFWFTYYIAVYYFLFLRLIRHRLLKFTPKMSTSQKAHGKWGDFIICFVPIAWCVNILSNSNFILRMLEWQTETSLFTVRVRGRQWYWVYKIELKDLLKSAVVSKSTGHGHWHVSAANDHDLVENALNSLQLLKYNEDYLKQLKSRMSSLRDRFASYNTRLGFYESASNKVDVVHYSGNFTKRATRGHFFTLINPLKFVLPIQDARVVWGDALQSVVNKTLPDSTFFVIKQKRFAGVVRKVNSVDFKKIDNTLNFSNAEFLIERHQNSNAFRWAAKRLKYKSADISSVYNRRLLRTKRILVLPTNMNLTVITNSFDVVHSWYIPGLGVKLDCIPGRSTHHTLYIDHAGFYYGQCAEICGRYHHHMPIRICALPFEHFLIWWYHYGLPCFNSINGARKDSTRGGIRQYEW